jgi:hypothetical protein
VSDVIYQGDNGTVLQLTIRDSSQVVDLSDATVKVLIRLKDMGILKDATILDAQNGKCQIILFSQDILYEGIYQLQATVTFSDGTTFSSTIQRFNVNKKMGYIPTTGGGSGSANIVGGNNGHILVNGTDIKVYDDMTLKSDVASLKSNEGITNNSINNINYVLSNMSSDIGELNNNKHNHPNLAILNSLSTDGMNLLFNGTTIGGSKIVQSVTNGYINVDGNDIKVYDDQILAGLINELNQYKTLLSRLGISSNGVLTIDGVEITAPTSPTPITSIDGGTFTTLTFDTTIDGGSFTLVPTGDPIDGGTY